MELPDECKCEESGSNHDCNRKCICKTGHKLRLEAEKKLKDEEKKTKDVTDKYNKEHHLKADVKKQFEEEKQKERDEHRRKMEMTRKFKDEEQKYNEEHHEKQDLQQKQQIETDKYNQEHCARVAVEAELKALKEKTCLLS
jgi:hypothetical protein